MRRGHRRDMYNRLFAAADEPHQRACCFSNAVSAEFSRYYDPALLIVWFLLMDDDGVCLEAIHRCCCLGLWLHEKLLRRDLCSLRLFFMLNNGGEMKESE